MSFCYLINRRPVVDVREKAKIVLEGPLRASVEVSLKISDDSYVKQLIVLDAHSPYLAFNTEVCTSLKNRTLNSMAETLFLKISLSFVVMRHCFFCLITLRLSVLIFT